MIVEHAGIKVDIPPFTFGNEYDIQIRDHLAKLHDALRPRKIPMANQERTVKFIMLAIKGTLEMKNKNNHNL